jgi:hypothetical protein
MLKQENVRLATRIAGAVAAVFFAVGQGSAGQISSRQGPDPILSGAPPGPCAEAAAGADYVAGVDATGHAVAPADETSAPLPDKEVLVTVPSRRGRDVSVPVDLARVAPPSCDARTPHHP